MACERYRNALTDAAAGAPALAELEAHLAGCDACRQELAALRRALAVVDGDLRQLLAAEPPPELAARIRLAAAEPEVGSGWRPAFALQALAAAAVLAAVAFVMLRGHQPAPAAVAALTPHPLASGSVQPATTTALPVPTAPPTVPPKPEEGRVPSTASARRAASHEPEVLVPPGQVEALQRLAALVNRERVASPSLAAVEQGSPELAAPQPIVVGSVEIKSLEIVPLDAPKESGT